MQTLFRLTALAAAALVLASACGGGPDPRRGVTPVFEEVTVVAGVTPTFEEVTVVGGVTPDFEEVTLVGGVPPGFEEVIVVGGLNQPTTFAFAPDGRIFIAEKQGVVRVFQEGSLLPTPFIDIRGRVNTSEHRGLMGLALDPDFQTNGYVYLLYTYEHDPADPDGPKTGQLVRVTADGSVALPGSERVLLGSVVGSASRPSCEDFAAGADCLPADANQHVGGGLRFASDGTLFVATGDSAGSDELRVRSQNLDSLAGKMLRINRDGSAPVDNPFFNGDSASNRSKVWAYGLREPFRFGLQPGTDLPFIGDVGSVYSEEINIAYPGSNLGWPCYEGRGRPYLIGDHPVCRVLVPLGPRAVTAPLYTYATRPGAAAVVGGDFALTYPDPYGGAYFFGDFARSCIAYLVVDDDGKLIDVQEFATAADGPVAIKTGPDGEIYYLAWNTGELRHIRWVAENRSPTADRTITAVVTDADEDGDGCPNPQ